MRRILFVILLSVLFDLYGCSGKSDGPQPNNPPIADAGADLVVRPGKSALLDATSCMDPDEDSLTYTWTFTTVPAQSAVEDASLAAPNSETPSFLPDERGIYQLELTVSDGEDSATDTVSIEVAGWSSPLDQTDNISPGISRVHHPRVELHESGHGISVWMQEHPSINNITSSFLMASVRDPVTGQWERSETLSEARISFTSGQISVISSAVNSSGDAVVAWSQKNGSAYRLFVAELDGATGEWTLPDSHADAINQDTTVRAYSHIGIDDDGNVLLIWVEDPSGGYPAFYSTTRDGAGTWTAVAHIYTPSNWSPFSGEVALNNAGDALITLVEDFSDFSGMGDPIIDFRIQVLERDGTDGTWGAIQVLDTITDMDWGVDLPPIAELDSSGNAVVAWGAKNFSSGANPDVMIAERDGTTFDWTLLGKVYVMESYEGFGSFSMDECGNAAIVWRTNYQSSDFMLERDPSEGTWGLAVLPDAFIPEGSGVRGPKISLSGCGKGAMTWETGASSGTTIAVSEKTAEGGWALPTTISIDPDPTDYYRPTNPDVAMTATGFGVAFWQEFDDQGTTQIFFSEYEER